MTTSHARGKKRNQAQRAGHRQTIADMRLKGHTIAEIVKHSRLSRSTVMREIRSLAAQWQASAVEATHEHRARELARLEAIEREAWAEWERSCKPYSKEVTERTRHAGKGEEGGDLVGEPTVIRRETGTRVGDAKFLQVVLSAVDARRKLLGLDAPSKVAPMDHAGEKPYRNMTDEEINARIRELDERMYAFPVPPNLSLEEWAAWAQSLNPPN